MSASPASISRYFISLTALAIPLVTGLQPTMAQSRCYTRFLWEGEHLDPPVSIDVDFSQPFPDTPRPRQGADPLVIENWSQIGGLTTAILRVVALPISDSDEVEIEGLGTVPVFTTAQDDYVGASMDLLTAFGEKTLLDFFETTAGKFKLTYRDNDMDSNAKLRGDLQIVLDFPQEYCTCFSASAWPQINWSGGSGPFSTGLNWTVGRPPGTDSTAVFDAAGSYTVDLTKNVTNNAVFARDGASITLDLKHKSYQLTTPGICPGIWSDNAVLTVKEGTVNSSGSVLATNGGSILVGDVKGMVTDGDVLLGDSDGRGSLTLSDSSSVTIRTPGVVDVGSGLNTKGADLIIEGAAVLNAEASVSFADDGGTLANASTGSVRDSGSALKTRLLVVGGQGEGELTVTDSGFVATTVLDLGSQTGGFGTVDVEGDGSKIELEDGFGRLGIGAEGRGFLTLKDGGQLKFADGEALLGNEFGGDGRITVDGKDASMEGGLLKVGVEGQGELFIRTGGEVKVDNLEIASGVSSSLTSQVAVEGSGSLLEVVGAIPVWVARAGHGALNVTAGGDVIIPQDLYVAVNEAGSAQGPADGSIKVSGTNSRLMVSGELRLGVRSAGNMTVETSGTAVLSTTTIGYEDDTSPKQSRLEVTSGAELTTQDLTVGRGTGVARVRSRGRIEVSRTLVVGEKGNSSGEVQVEDTGSSIDARFAVVGALGSGTLNVFSGGVARFDRLTVNTGTVRGNVQVGGATPKAELFSKTHVDTLGWVATDTLVFNDGAIIEADSVTFAGGVLGGNGSFPFDVVNSGVVSPGDSTGTPGTFKVGASYTQTSEGLLDIELGGLTAGEEHDHLAVSDTASIGGTVRLTVLAGTTPPEPGNVYTIVSATLISGAFETLELQEGLTGAVSYSDTEVVFTVTGFSSVSIEDDASAELPAEFALHQNYPNPFNPSTIIAYDLPASSFVRLVVHDYLGRKAVDLLNTRMPAGRHEITWDARDFASGLYIYRIEAGEFVATRTMFLAK